MSQEIVSAIDPKLKYVRDLASGTKASSKVYRVEYYGEPYVLKVDPCFGTPIQVERSNRHIQREMEVLSNSKHIDGIPELVEVYWNKYESSIEAILKEYVYGTDLFALSREGKRIGREACLGLQRTVEALWGLGYVRQDLTPRNIVWSQYQDKAQIIDLGTCLHRDTISEEAFERYRSEDKNDIEFLRYCPESPQILGLSF